jgi:cytochrome c biogenesis protein CcdA/thiol-disulfide isomerase/thioredoxin
MLVLIFFSFLAGLVTILSPCILPVLPIVLTSSLSGGRRRPLGVVTGFVLSFTFFTLALTALVRSTGISAEFLRWLAIAIILFLGISMFLPKTKVMLEKLVGKLMKFTPKKKGNDGFSGGVLIGLSLGLVWTPCAGPILASVIVLAATSAVTFQAVLITLAYSIGTAIPMVAIIYGGRALLSKVPCLLKNSAKIQKIFGVIIIVVALAMVFNIDRKFQSWLLQQFPNYGAGLTQLEELDVVRTELDALDMYEEEEDVPLVGTIAYDSEGHEVEGVVITPVACNTKHGWAPELDGGGEWINSEPLKMSELSGKPVLIDFWTYTCINCIRTLPHIKAWHEKYKDEGLTIIGVHTPEFEFEKDVENVREAVEDFGIEYPVVLDNDYAIWSAYKNRYWPAKYFVGDTGCIEETHFGEGEYTQSEMFIKHLLKKAGSQVDADLIEMEEYSGEARTPELYLGYGRMANWSSMEKIPPDEVAGYTFPVVLDESFWAYAGMWNIGRERAISDSAVSELLPSIRLNFVGKEVYLVMRADEGGRVEVRLDGEVVSAEEAGEDVIDGVVQVGEDRLYRLIELDKYDNRELELRFLDPNIEVYAFTFG